MLQDEQVLTALTHSLMCSNARRCTTSRGALALTYTQDDEGCVLPVGQQQEVDQVVGDKTEAEDHGTPLLEALACGEGRRAA